MKTIMILAGEPSGDVHGANLVKELFKKDPELSIFGIGGDDMAAQGMELIFHIRELSVMGATEVLMQFKVIRRAFQCFRRCLNDRSPDLVILIDYPGFNLRAAAVAKGKGIPVLYYITPKVWAWKKSRLKTMKQVIDQAALIFPFETAIYRRAGVPATFVGNPLLDMYDSPIQFQAEISGRPFVIGLLPGSRKTEISVLLPVMLDACRLLRQNPGNVQFIVSQAPSVDDIQFNAIMETHDPHMRCRVIRGEASSVFDAADFLIAASGTVTLEAAIRGIPMIIVYRMSPLSFFLAKSLVNVPFAGLANIIAGEEIVPELLQDEANPSIIASATRALMAPDMRLGMHQKLLMVKRMLGDKGASKRTAGIALSMIR